MEKPTTQRSAALDTLRGIAVLLVLFRHMPLSEKLPGWLLAPLQVLKTGGWVGVDLFFVLSGFLVSGLLFKSWLESGSLQGGRFLIRRGFKIYPAFLAMLAVVFGWAAYQGRFPGWNRVLTEVLFVQNYAVSVFPHTWSLAVEEHFYLTLPLLLLALRFPGEKPFRWLPTLVLAIAVTCLSLRLAATAGADPARIARENPFQFRSWYVSTHLRCDALFFGVLLSWLFHFHRLKFEKIAKQRWALLAAGLALLAPAFIFQLGPSAWMFSWGFTAMYLGAGALLLAFVGSGWSLRPVASIGFYSYSIYLWHIPVERMLMPMVLPAGTDAGTRLTFYLTASIAIGVIFAWLVETPALRLRDRFFPARKRSPDTGTVPAIVSAPSA